VTYRGQAARDGEYWDVVRPLFIGLYAQSGRIERRCMCRPTTCQCGRLLSAQPLWQCRFTPVAVLSTLLSTSLLTVLRKRDCRNKKIP